LISSARLELEIGIVCARCETYAVLGTAACVSCGHALAFETVSAPISAPVSSKVPPTTREQPVAEAAKDARDADAAPRTEVLPASRPEASPKAAPVAVPAAASGARASSVSRSDPRAEPAGDELSPRSTRGAVVARPSSAGFNTPAKSSKGKSVEELMDQAKNFVCRSCSTAVPLGHKFCGRCGAAVPPEILQARTQFFGQLQAPGKAKLILIRGEGVEGLSYQLNAEHHVVGRTGQLVFPDDPFVSPTHADFFYRNGKLVVKDEGSINGVYLRVKGAVDVQPDDFFLAGEQVFRIDATPKASDQPGPDGTYFYSSPKHQSPFRITQMLQGGSAGMTVCARGSSLQIGREGGDLNFPSDLYMSAAHCKIEEAGGKLMLTDMNSRNGSYVRLKAERELSHGDYVFIGRKLLRVEITAA
jgi:pSer/pThr/pTyr-binding forkhead associated (FHA) protein